ncbi:MAG TPA: ATP-binding protein [Stellaceae bacterium]|nr:ATP-binding protein [Stellaceae bacterium]
MSALITAQRILTVTRLRARRLALWTEHLWQTGQASPDQGPAIGPAEVSRLLTPAAIHETEAAFYVETAADLSAETTAAAEALAGDPGWSTICRLFGLTGEDAELLALLLAVELDPGLTRVVAYLHDDGRLTHPTPWLAARLAGSEPAPRSHASLRRWLLASPIDGTSPERLTSPWQADPAVAQAIHSGIWDDPAIADQAMRIEPAAAAALPCLHPQALAALAQLPDPRDVELVGPPGIGRQTLAAQHAAAVEIPLLAVDLQPLIDGGGTAGALINRTLRQAVMTGALAYFRNAEAVPESEWKRARSLGVPYLRGVRHSTGEAEPIVLSPLPITARVDLWRRMTEAPPPPALVTLRLTPGEIARAVAQPAATSLRQRRRRPDHSLLTLLPVPYDWDDLVLPADVTGQLRAFESQVRLRWPVYEEWGLARLTHLGQGISALFGGPSGTGKTMAAQVIARSLGLDLLRVDLAGVVNKYIGETEKKLREVFDACEDSGAVLFFDEADALFGNRTQVKDAHDRFANIEIDYLLQRIERFDGVAILATNRRQDLDPAFVRRLRFVIEFLPPRPAERRTLWHHALPENAPDGQQIRDEVDWAYLSERLAMTGAEIKSTALSAAFLAREEGVRIGMRHILTAAQREMAKQGQRLRMPLQEAGE